MTVLGEHGESYATFLAARDKRIAEREEAHAAERYEDREHVFSFWHIAEGVGVKCRCGWISKIVGSKTTAERLAHEHFEASA